MVGRVGDRRWLQERVQDGMLGQRIDGVVVVVGKSWHVIGKAGGVCARRYVRRADDQEEFVMMLTV